MNRVPPGMLDSALAASSPIGAPHPTQRINAGDGPQHTTRNGLWRTRHYPSNTTGNLSGDRDGGRDRSIARPLGRQIGVVALAVAGRIAAAAQHCMGGGITGRGNLIAEAERRALGQGTARVVDLGQDAGGLLGRVEPVKVVRRGSASGRIEPVEIICRRLRRRVGRNQRIPCRVHTRLRGRLRCELRPRANPGPCSIRGCQPKLRRVPGIVRHQRVAGGIDPWWRGHRLRREHRPGTGTASLRRRRGWRQSEGGGIPGISFSDCHLSSP